MENGFAECLGRDGAGVDGCPAEDVAFFDDADLFSELGGLYGGLLPPWTGADDDAVEMPHITFPRRGYCGWLVFCAGY